MAWRILFAFVGAVFAVELEEDRGIRHGHGGFEDEDLVVLAGLADVEAAVLGSRCPQD